MIVPQKMTEKERRTYTEIVYYDALRMIGKEYKTAKQVMDSSWNDYGLPPLEALVMAYENLQEEAKVAIKGKRRPKEPRT